MVTGKELLEDGWQWEMWSPLQDTHVMNRQTPISQISHDMPRTDAEGFRYLPKIFHSSQMEGGSIPGLP